MTTMSMLITEELCEPEGFYSSPKKICTIDENDPRYMDEEQLKLFLCYLKVRRTHFFNPYFKPLCKYDRLMTLILKTEYFLDFEYLK